MTPGLKPLGMPKRDKEILEGEGGGWGGDD